MYAESGNSEESLSAYWIAPGKKPLLYAEESSLKTETSVSSAKNLNAKRGKKTDKKNFFIFFNDNSENGKSLQKVNLPDGILRLPEFLQEKLNPSNNG